MKRFVVSVATAATLAACSGTPARNQNPTSASAAPGPLPTLRLPRTLVPTSYQLAVTIDPRLEGFAGKATIKGTVATPSSLFWLHGNGLHISSADVHSAGTTSKVLVQAVGEDLLAVTTPAPVSGDVQLTFEYTSTYESKDTLGVFKMTVDRDPSVFTQFEATYARRAWPCFDEPNVKVPWTLSIDAPAGFDAVANTLPSQTTTLPNGMVHTEFAPTQPLPSYLVAFAVGHFDFVPAGKTASGAPIRIITPHGRAAEASYAAATTARLVAILETWFGTAYPYDKLDMISMPVTVGWGAMENAGLITFTESLILLDPNNSSWASRHDWASVAGHELAHQWFGNLVTTAWWDDIWLNEGFASWMEAKILMAFDPSWHEELSTVETWQQALDADSLVSARQVRQPIKTIDDVNTAFDSITYQKGSAVLSMFEQAIGPNVFQKGVQMYLQQHRFGNATSADFTAAMSQAAGRDISAAFATFLDRPGAPSVSAHWECDGQAPNVVLTQQRYLPPGSVDLGTPAPWTIPTCLAAGPAANVKGAAPRTDVCATLDAAKAIVSFNPLVNDCDSWLLLNAGGRGFFRTALNDNTLQALTQRGWSQLTAAERLALFIDARTSVETGAVKLTALLNLLPLMIAERNRFAVSQAIDVLQDLRPHVPESMRDRFDAWVVKLLGAQAKIIGWLPRATDDIDAENMRDDVVTLAAFAGEPTLRAEAVKLAADWRKLPQSVRGNILMIAVRADAATFNKVVAELPTEASRRFRSEMIQALGAVTSLEQAAQAMKLVLNRALDPRETEKLLSFEETEKLRDQTEAFFTAHFDELLKLLPSESTTGSAVEWVHIYTNVCRSDGRAAIAKQAQQRFGKMVGAERTIAQALEQMDQCAAARTMYGPQLRLWLADTK